MILNISTSLLELKKKLVLGKDPQISLFAQKSIKYCSLRDDALNFKPFEPPWDGEQSYSSVFFKAEGKKLRICTVFRSFYYYILIYT